MKQNKWSSLPFPAQMANIGSEVNRAISWRNKGNQKYSQGAFERSLELLELTISDYKNKKRLKELTRLYEVWVDYFAFDNEYSSSEQLWLNYFFGFNFMVRKGT